MVHHVLLVYARAAAKLEKGLIQIKPEAAPFVTLLGVK
jgi:hypothetical protein